MSSTILHGRTFLETREALLQELEAMKRGELRADPEVFDRERFERYYCTYVEQVITEIPGRRELIRKAIGRMPMAWFQWACVHFPLPITL